MEVDGGELQAARSSWFRSIPGSQLPGPVCKIRWAVVFMLTSKHGSAARVTLRKVKITFATVLHCGLPSNKTDGARDGLGSQRVATTNRVAVFLAYAPFAGTPNRGAFFALLPLRLQCLTG
jgi:hypothetical protein